MSAYRPNVIGCHQHVQFHDATQHVWDISGTIGAATRVKRMMVQGSSYNSHIDNRIYTYSDVQFPAGPRWNGSIGEFLYVPVDLVRSGTSILADVSMQLVGNGRSSATGSTFRILPRFTCALPPSNMILKDSGNQGNTGDTPQANLDYVVENTIVADYSNCSAIDSKGHSFAMGVNRTVVLEYPSSYGPDHGPLQFLGKDPTFFFGVYFLINRVTGSSGACKLSFDLFIKVTPYVKDIPVVSPR